MIIIAIILILIILWVLFWQANLIWAQILGAPTVYSSDKAVEDAFLLAKLKADETVLDLGCGNAKSLIIAAKKFQAKGIGVERSLYCVVVARFRVWLAGESKNIKIYFKDLRDCDELIKEADLVYLYLLNIVLGQIENKIFDNLSEKGRVVSLAFLFPHKKFQESITTVNLGRKTKIYLY